MIRDAAAVGLVGDLVNLGWRIGAERELVAVWLGRFPFSPFVRKTLLALAVHRVPVGDAVGARQRPLGSDLAEVKVRSGWCRPMRAVVRGKDVGRPVGVLEGHVARLSG